MNVFKTQLRVLLTGLAAIFAVPFCIPLWSHVAASAPSTEVQITMETSNVVPRPLEAVTEHAILKSYSAAWGNMETALAENRPDLLDESFIGYAHDRLAAQIKAQQKNGMTTRYIDRGHKLEALFYSPEGSAVQVRDTAQLEIQLLDGDKVVSSQQTTRRYIAIITVVEDRWKVRILQGIQE